MEKINKKRLIYVMFLSLIYSVSFSQNTRTDSLRSDSLRQIADKSILDQSHRQETDSLIRMQLQTELLKASGNEQKTKVLEEKIRQAFISDSIHKEEQLQHITELKKSNIGYPVSPFKDTLFFIYVKVGSFNAQERAQAIADKISKLYALPSFVSDSFRVNENEGSYDLLYNGQRVIMSVTRMDALWSGKPGSVLATEYLNKIKAAITEERKANSLSNWIKRIGLVFLIVFVLVILIYFINRLFKRLTRWLLKNNDKYLTGFSFRKVKLLTPEKQLQLALRIKNILRVVVILIAIYLSLPLLFSLFPETKTYTDILLGWILTPAKAALHGFVKFLPNLFTILVIYFLFKYLIKGFKYFVDEIQKGNINLSGFHPEWAKPTFNIAKFLLYAFMIVLMFPYLPGSGSPAFQGVSVFVGILFSLGSSSAISNMVAGLVITYMRPFKVGDRVKIGDVIGDVIEKTMLVTRVRTIKNEDVTVPNATVLSSNTVNFSSNVKPEDKGLIMHSTVTIGYDVPWKDMHQALLSAADRTEKLLKEPKPFVLQTSLDDFYVSYQINAYTRDANDQANIYSLLHQHIQDCCNEAGIEILSPHYRAARDGNMTTIPGQYLSKDYKSPTFNVNVQNNDGSDSNQK